MTNTTNNKRRRRMAREPQSSSSVQPGIGSDASLQNPTASAAPARQPSKTDKVLELLKREGGATLEELVETTGWLPHTRRAALTGLRKKGHPIERSKIEGVSRYTLAEPVAQ